MTSGRQSDRTVNPPLDFIVIGASKSGTTTLFEHLKRHPEIYIPGNKEVPFFSKDSLYEMGWAAFLKEFFSEAEPGALLGSVSPQYLEDAPRAARRIAASLPSVRLIAQLRNPIDRAHSAYRMRVWKGRETRSFEDVVEAQLDPEALSQARELDWSLGTVTDRYLVTSEYGRLLGEFLRHFERDRLCVLFAEDLARAPEVLLDELLEFLDLEPGFRPASLGRRYYRGGTGMRSSKLIRWASRIAPLRWLWSGLPRERRRRLKWWVQTELGVRRSGKTIPPIGAEVRARLREHYRPDVAELARRFEVRPPWPEFAETPATGAEPEAQA